MEGGEGRQAVEKGEGGESWGAGAMALHLRALGLKKALSLIPSTHMGAGNSP